MQRTGVLSDSHVLEECADATFPIPASQYDNVFGPEKSSVFVHRQPKGYRAPPQTTMEYVAKNKASGGGTGRILAQNLAEENMRSLMQRPGAFNSLQPPPLLAGSLTQNFRVQNIAKMTKVVERPKQQAIENVRSQTSGGVSTQPHVVSRILALSNAQVPPPAGFSSTSGSTIVLPLRNTVTSNATASTGQSISDKSTRSNMSVSGMSSVSKDSRSSISSDGTGVGVSRAMPFNDTDAMERGLAGPSAIIRQDPALRGSFGAEQQRMLAETIRDVNNPILRTDETFTYTQRQLRSGSTQETGMGSPSLSLERPEVQPRGQAGPSSSQPPKAQPPPDA